MKQNINKYTVAYAIQLVLNIICIILVYNYYSFIDIPIKLMAGFAFDLPHFLSIIIIEILLCLFFIATLVSFVISVKQSRDNGVKKPVRILTIILPLIFVFLCMLSVGIPIAAAQAMYFPSQEPSVAVLFNDLKNSENDVSTYSICEKNNLGKAAYYEQNAFLEEKGEIEFLCSYQESDCKFIQNKFERIDNKYYALKNEEAKDNYTLYYEQGDDSISYSILIEEDGKYFVSTFDSYNNDYFNSYSKEQFVSDCLGLYNEWSNF
ncbi:MAG: hypothetical protein ACI4IK_03880 [Eubacterium sp.]